MNKGTILLSLALLSGCAASQPELPLSADQRPKPAQTLVWVGSSQSYAFKDGIWQRAPAMDYEFSVIQRRYATYWDSIKTLQRRHPEYDGSAGPRNQTYHFRVDYQQEKNQERAFEIVSTIGDGGGKIDQEFRNGVFELAASVSSFAPYDTYKFVQKYLYEEGKLIETLELVKKGGGREVPFAKIEEQAQLFSGDTSLKP